MHTAAIAESGYRKPPSFHAGRIQHQPPAVPTPHGLLAEMLLSFLIRR